MHFVETIHYQTHHISTTRIYDSVWLGLSEGECGRKSCLAEQIAYCTLILHWFGEQIKKKCQVIYWKAQLSSLKSLPNSSNRGQ